MKRCPLCGGKMRPRQKRCDACGRLLALKFARYASLTAAERVWLASGGRLSQRGRDRV